MNPSVIAGTQGLGVRACTRACFPIFPNYGILDVDLMPTRVALRRPDTCLALIDAARWRCHTV